MKDENFINFLKDKIYNDCAGDDIEIKENPLLYISNTNLLKLAQINEQYLKWPNYNREIVKDILTKFSSREPFGKFVSGIKDKGLVGITPQFTFESELGEMQVVNDGRDILKCGDNALDVNEVRYYWNEEEVEFPVEYHSSVFTVGKISIIDFSLFSILGISVIGFAILGIKKLRKNK